MREQIFAAIIRSNKTETFCIIEPLNCTSCHVKLPFLKNGKNSRETI